jgi:hypothetical protein
MITSRGLAVLTVVTIAAAGGFPATRLGAVPAHQATARKVDAEHARLTAMIGDWDVAMTLWPRPGGAGIPARGTSALRPLFDGLYIEEKI